jgi:inorganic pyrophosphatase
MVDSGARDAKIIAVVDADPRFETIHDINDIPQLQLREIKLFFRTYKELLPNHDVEVREYHNCEEALVLIDKCLKNYQRRQKK